MKKIIVIMNVLLLLLVTACKHETINPPLEENKNYTTFSESVVKDVIIRNHNVAYYDNIYHVYLEIENENNISINYSTLTIRYYRDSALIYSITQSITSIAAHSTIDIAFDIDINLVNANRVEYSIN